MVSPAYIPGPQQTDQQARARAATLGIGIAPRDVSPIYQPYVPTLPGVVAEGGGSIVFIADDGSLTAQQITTTVAPLVAAQAAADTASANAQTLVQRAQAALTANATFLAIAAPTNAQVLAQVQRLTKEVNALIRLGQGLVADISDTA